MTTPDYGVPAPTTSEALAETFALPDSAPTEAAPAAPRTRRPVAMFAGEAEVADDGTPSDPSSLFDEFERDVAESISTTKTYIVTQRKGYEVEFSLDNVSVENMKRYQKQAQGRKKRPEDADPLIVSGMTLAENHLAIYKNGVKLMDKDYPDEALVFATDTFVRSMKQEGVVESIVAFLGEGDTLSISGALYEAAGFGGDALEANPKSR